MSEKKSRETNTDGQDEQVMARMTMHSRPKVVRKACVCVCHLRETPYSSPCVGFHSSHGKFFLILRPIETSICLIYPTNSRHNHCPMAIVPNGDLIHSCPGGGPNRPDNAAAGQRFHGSRAWKLCRYAAPARALRKENRSHFSAITSVVDWIIIMLR